MCSSFLTTCCQILGRCSDKLRATSYSPYNRCTHACAAQVVRSSVCDNAQLPILCRREVEAVLPHQCHCLPLRIYGQRKQRGELAAIARRALSATAGVVSLAVVEETRGGPCARIHDAEGLCRHGEVAEAARGALTVGQSGRARRVKLACVMVLAQRRVCDEGLRVAALRALAAVGASDVVRSAALQTEEARRRLV